mgnify:CR=1 FL=1
MLEFAYEEEGEKLVLSQEKRVCRIGAGFLKSQALGQFLLSGTKSGFAARCLPISLGKQRGQLFGQFGCFQAF